MFVNTNSSTCIDMFLQICYYICMNETLTIKDVARALKVDVTTVRRYIRQGHIKGIKLGSSKTGSQWRVTVEELTRFVSVGVKGKESCYRL
jgi:excisionase family DNA binding protein